MTILKDRLRKLERKILNDSEKRIDAVIFSLLPASLDALPVFNDRATCDDKEFFRLSHESEKEFINRIENEVKEKNKIKLIWLHPQKEDTKAVQ